MNNLIHDINLEVNAILGIDGTVDFMLFENVHRHLLPFVVARDLEDVFYQALALVVDRGSRWRLIRAWRMLKSRPLDYCHALILVDIYYRRNG